MKHLSIPSPLPPALALLLSVCLAASPPLACARQDANATLPSRKKVGDEVPKGVTDAPPTHSSGRGRRRPRANRGASQGRSSAGRFVTLTIVSNLPYCGVLINGEPEEKGTDEQGRLSIPLEPGLYDVSLTNPGYVTEGREVEVGAGPPYRQEEKFVLKRALLRLQVKTNPPGVKVILDGTREGESDADGLLTFDQVDPSEQHTLRAFKENYREETVTVPPHKREASIRLARDLLTLKVKTYPPQAEVFLDDAPKGTSDGDGVLLITKVKTDKEHTLRASKEGYITQSETVPANYELALIKLPPVGEAPSPSAGQTDPGGQTGQGAPNKRPDARDGDGTMQPVADTPQGIVERPRGVTPSMPQDGERSSPPPQKSEQYGVSISPLEVELAFWNTIKDSKRREEFAAYLRKYPEGQFVELARIRMDALLATMKAEPDPAAAQSAPEPLRPTPTPTPTPSPTLTPVQPSTPGPLPATELTSAPDPAAAPEAQRQPSVAVLQPATVGEPPAPDALEESINRLRKNFASKFTYTITQPRQAAGGIHSVREASIDVEPLRFEGCRIEWRVFDNVHRVSLSDLDPTDIKVELRTDPGTTYSIKVWSVTLAGAGGREAFERLDGGRGANPKKYWRLVLLYDNKGRAEDLAAAFGHAISLCGSKSQR